MVRVREIEETDLPQVVTVLTRGFERVRNQCYWQQAIARLATNRTPSGMPRFGYLLEHDQQVVGVLLMICTTVIKNGEPRIRCNVSSWYVDPSFRLYGTLLAQRAIKYPGVTFFNVSPARPTWTILEAQGFTRFAKGRTIAAPWLSQAVDRSVVIHRVTANEPLALTIDPDQVELDLLSDHAAYGCLSLLCETQDAISPFVFGLQYRLGLVPVAHLVYCRSLDSFVRMARPLGKHLLRRGFGLVILDSDGPIAGLVGKHFGGRPRYMKGLLDEIRIGDVAYSEQVMFGY